MMADLLSEIHERGEPSDTDTTIAAHLLRIRDPSTGMHPAQLMHNKVAWAAVAVSDHYHALLL